MRAQTKLRLGCLVNIAAELSLQELGGFFAFYFYYAVACERANEFIWQ
jgi:hypothetical protein